MDKTIIHLSDLHVGKDDDRLPRMVRLRDFISLNYPEVPVLITGDITDSGTIPQLQKARGWARDLAESNPVFMVPGNHDYAFKGFWAFRNANDSFEYWEQYLGQPMGVGERGVLPNTWMPCIEFPHDGYGRFQLDDYTQLFYVDSGDLDREAWCAQGWISEGMIRALSADLQKYCAWTRIVMLHHHPFNTMFHTKLKGADEFMKCLQKHGCELLLFGHKHDGGRWDPVVDDWAPSDYKIPCISASHSSTNRVTGKHGAITVITMNNVGTSNISFYHRLELVEFD